MFDGSFGIFLVILTVVLLVALPFINWFYKKRADTYWDELLKSNPVEYNKQIKGNAYRYLVGGSVWGFIFLSGFILNFRGVIDKGFHWQTIIVLILGLGSFGWGFWRYKRELRKLLH